MSADQVELGSGVVRRHEQVRLVLVGRIGRSGLSGGRQALEIELVGVAFAVHLGHDVLVVVISATISENSIKLTGLSALRRNVFSGQMDFDSVTDWRQQMPLHSPTKWSGHRVMDHTTTIFGGRGLTQRDGRPADLLSLHLLGHPPHSLTVGASLKSKIKIAVIAYFQVNRCRPYRILSFGHGKSHRGDFMLIRLVFIKKSKQFDGKCKLTEELDSICRNSCWAWICVRPNDEPLRPGRST